MIKLLITILKIIKNFFSEINKEIEKENILDYFDDYSYYRHPNKFY